MQAALVVAGQVDHHRHGPTPPAHAFSPRAPPRTGPTRTVSHVRVFRSGCLVAPDREGPDAFSAPRHAVSHPLAERLTHAPVRRAGL
jgi:hypothetical protein